MRKHFGLTAAAAAVALTLPLLASAQVKVGVTVSSTGPAASLGIPERNTVALLPKEVAGQKIEWIVLDDATDTTQAVKNSRKLASDDKVDVLIGTSVTPGSLAMVDVAAEAKVPMISVAASAKIVEPVDDKRRWVFKTPQNDALMAGALADAMSSQGQDAGLHRLRRRLRRRLAGRDAEGRQGQGHRDRLDRKIQPHRHQRDRPGPEAGRRQARRHPDRRRRHALGPAAKELRARNYGGVIYQTHGAANNDVLRVCGKDCDGMFLPAGPLLVAAQLPDSNPVKKSALAYVETYEKAHGAGSTNTFGGHMWDAGQLVVAALPAALKTGAKPGTPEFRVAMRDALESIKDLPASQGVFNMSPTDHAGFDERSRVIVKVEGGKWVYQPGL